MFPVGFIPDGDNITALLFCFYYGGKLGLALMSEPVADTDGKFFKLHSINLSIFFIEIAGIFNISICPAGQEQIGRTFFSRTVFIGLQKDVCWLLLSSIFRDGLC
jgi:hypothetical protein